MPQTEEKEEMQKDDFYEDLERIYMKEPKYDIKVVMGDFNAQRWVKNQV
jgi:exonuclease III